jgi:CubicO group peptidase (beta-lactamase class C family)
MTFAETRLRTSVQVFRDNCLVASDPVGALTGDVPWNIFSSTKSVVSMLAGIAYTQGKLDIDAPIGRYLPAGIGDTAHRAITVRDLLTQSSGLQQSILTEAAPGLAAADENAPAQAMALPLQYKRTRALQYATFISGRAC